MESEKSTEEKIKEAAKAVFLTKGFEGCSSREIAGAAGMNVALVNYYFKSKGHLFQIILAGGRVKLSALTVLVGDDMNWGGGLNRRVKLMMLTKLDTVYPVIDKQYLLLY